MMWTSEHTEGLGALLNVGIKVKGAAPDTAGLGAEVGGSFRNLV